MEKDMLIAVADFSTYPSGRDQRDGEFNGTKFRQDVLVPAFREALSRGSRVIVSLANVMSFGSSFLEEAFGGLVRSREFSKAQIKAALKIEAGAAENVRYSEAIFRYIDRA